MIAKALILLTRGWQLGPSKVLPPSCRYQPSCSAYAITALATLWRGQRRLAGPQTHLPLPSLGRTGPRPGPLKFSRTDLVNDNRNMLLAIVLSALVLLGWSLLSEKFFPTAGPQTQQVENGKVEARRRSRKPILRPTRPRRSATATSCWPKRRGSGSKRRACRARSTSRARGSTIWCWSRSARPSPRIRRRSACCRRPAPRTAISRSSAGPARASPRPTPTASGPPARRSLTPGKPVTLSWTNPTGQRFEQIVSVDDGYLFTVKQRVVNGGSGRGRPFAPTASPAGRPRARTRRAGPSMSARSATLAARPTMTSTGKRSTRTRPGVTLDSRGGWLGFTDKYWLTALAPANGAPIEASFKQERRRAPTRRTMLGAPFVVAPGQAVTGETRLFAGAKEYELARPLRERRASPSSTGRSTGAGSDWFMIADLQAACCGCSRRSAISAWRSSA